MTEAEFDLSVGYGFGDAPRVDFCRNALRAAPLDTLGYSFGELSIVKITRPVFSRCAVDFQTTRSNAAPAHALIGFVLLLVDNQCDSTGVFLWPVSVHSSRVVRPCMAKSERCSLFLGFGLIATELTAHQIPKEFHSLAAVLGNKLTQDAGDAFYSLPPANKFEPNRE
jgi:hypothetical protein